MCCIFWTPSLGWTMAMKILQISYGWKPIMSLSLISWHSQFLESILFQACEWLTSCFVPTRAMEKAVERVSTAVSSSKVTNSIVSPLLS